MSKTQGSTPAKGETEVKSKAKPVQTKDTISFFTFFKFTTGKDKVLITFGTLSSVLAGFAVPGMAVAMGFITNSFNPHNDPEDSYNAMKIIALVIALVGIALWIFGYVFYAFWQHVAENISFDLRSRYLHKLME